MFEADVHSEHCCVEGARVVVMDSIAVGIKGAQQQLVSSPKL